MESQKTSNSQINLEKEKQNWRNHPYCLHNILQSHSDQDSTVLEQNQKYRSMDQHRKLGDKPIHHGHLIFDKRGANILYSGEKDSFFNKWCWENWTATCKNEIRTFPNTIHTHRHTHTHTDTHTQNNPQIKDLNERSENIKLNKRRQNTLT